MYFTVLVYFKGESQSSTLWEERLYLIEAVSEEAAKEKAKNIGVGQEHSYGTNNEEVVSWKFDRVDQIQALDDGVRDGTELFSRYLSESEALSIQSSLDEF